MGIVFFILKRRSGRMKVDEIRCATCGSRLYIRAAEIHPGIELTSALTSAKLRDFDGFFLERGSKVQLKIYCDKKDCPKPAIWNSDAKRVIRYILEGFPDEKKKVNNHDLCGLPILKKEGK